MQRLEGLNPQWLQYEYLRSQDTPITLCAEMSIRPPDYIPQVRSTPRIADVVLKVGNTAHIICIISQFGRKIRMVHSHQSYLISHYGLDNFNTIMEFLFSGLPVSYIPVVDKTHIPVQYIFQGKKYLLGQDLNVPLMPKTEREARRTRLLRHWGRATQEESTDNATE